MKTENCQSPWKIHYSKRKFFEIFVIEDKKKEIKIYYLFRTSKSLLNNLQFSIFSSLKSKCTQLEPISLSSGPSWNISSEINMRQLLLRNTVQKNATIDACMKCLTVWWRWRDIRIGLWVSFIRTTATVKQNKTN